MLWEFRKVEGVLGSYSDEKKFVSKEDDTKYKQEKYNGAAKYQKIVESKDDDYYDTYFAYRTADGAYTEGYHGGNLTDKEKKELGKQFDKTAFDGKHKLK